MKNTYRKKYQILRQNAQNKQERAIALSKKLQSHPLYHEKENILLFLSLKDEISTDPIIKMAWQNKKYVFIPKVHGKTITFALYRPEMQLIKSTFGVKELLEEKHPYTNEDHKSLLLVPGLAFDQKNYRLGYGGGYYDRFLSMHPSLYSIGIGFHEQYCENLPSEAWDFPLDEVLFG